MTYVMLVVCYHKTAINYYRRSMSDSVLLGEGSVAISYLEIRGCDGGTSKPYEGELLPLRLGRWERHYRAQSLQVTTADKRAYT